MKVNWSVRLKSKSFWVALISAVLLLVQLILRPLGIEINIDFLGQYTIDILNALFMVLAIVGVVNDPTVEGLHDSERVLKSKKDE
ncbi:phage holin [Carnobacterium maltaromaticum]|uniref:Phage holin n=1 Tax=Carnobacterium maltaromaticum TaxID=2751 RepID=A0AAW9K557_CARML|nr:phage holin [Carnobacterium maltaromaticum]MDZ5759329.1 phage holin [Carnobacterium maltaromaticum]